MLTHARRELTSAPAAHGALGVTATEINIPAMYNHEMGGQKCQNKEMTHWPLCAE